MAEVILDNVSKVYPGGVRAVRGASLTVRDKEFVVLVGPSGCGKSTLLRMVAGLEAPTEGKVSIDGRLVNDVAPKDRDVAMVFQNYALYPHMTVYENMAFGLRRRGYSKEEMRARVQETAELLDIARLLDRKPKALSGGERQRVAVGRAIVRKPKVFLLDEPLSNLDAKLRVAMRAELIRLHQRLQTSMIYVTHDQAEAMTMGDRIAVLDRGVIQQVAEPLTLYDQPCNQFVAGFVGTPPTNFMRGRIQSQAGCTFERGAIRVGVPAAAAARLTGYAEREIVLGIRPEDISLAESDRADTSKLRVEVVEPMGSETWVYLGSDGLVIIARVPPLRHSALPRAGQTISVRLDMSKAHFYDPQSEAAIV
jgi:multiple sugar transport system ATP-binding protein